jgi:hypothetical protein
MLWLFLLGAAEISQAALLISLNEPKNYGQKSILKMELQNTFSEPIESARAVVFLIDNNGKVVRGRSVNLLDSHANFQKAVPVAPLF